MKYDSHRVVFSIILMSSLQEFIKWSMDWYLRLSELNLRASTSTECSTLSVPFRIQNNRLSNALCETTVMFFSPRGSRSMKSAGGADLRTTWSSLRALNSNLFYKLGFKLGLTSKFSHPVHLSHSSANTLAHCSIVIIQQTWMQTSSVRLYFSAMETEP